MGQSQDLYGHTGPKTTMMYARSELANDRDALERLGWTRATGAVAASTPVLAGPKRWQSDAGASQDTWRRGAGDRQKPEKWKS